MRLPFIRRSTSSTYSSGRSTSVKRSCTSIAPISLPGTPGQPDGRRRYLDHVAPALLGQLLDERQVEVQLLRLQRLEDALLEERHAAGGDIGLRGGAHRLRALGRVRRRPAPSP